MVVEIHDLIQGGQRAHRGWIFSRSAPEKMSNFTRNDLAEALRLQANIPAKIARQHVEIVINAMASSLATQRNIELRGFGVFSVFKRRPKVGRNPRHPEAGAYAIPAKHVVRFRAGRDLDDRLNPQVAPPPLAVPSPPATIPLVSPAV